MTTSVDMANLRSPSDRVAAPATISGQLRGGGPPTMMRMAQDHRSRIVTAVTRSNKPDARYSGGNGGILAGPPLSLIVGFRNLVRCSPSPGLRSESHVGATCW